MANSQTLPSANVLTAVGAFSLAASYYGTFDQGGNVEEWNDGVSTTYPTFRGARGGDWYVGENDMRSTLQAYFGPALENYVLGFRVAMVPEPSAVGLMALGIALLAWQRKRTL